MKRPSRLKGSKQQRTYETLCRCPVAGWLLGKHKDAPQSYWFLSAVLNFRLKKDVLKGIQMASSLYLIYEWWQMQADRTKGADPLLEDL